MTLWVCGGGDGCGTKYAVGLFRCPRCHNTAFYEDGDPMAKITRHGGASDKTLPTSQTAGAATEPPANAAPAPQPEAHGQAGPEVDAEVRLAARIGEEGEESSPGNSSSVSTEMPPMNSEQSEQPPLRRARKTASRSKQAPTESASVPSTDGAKTAPTPAVDSAEG